jgi:hypothetical protein
VATAVALWLQEEVLLPQAAVGDLSWAAVRRRVVALPTTPAVLKEETPLQIKVTKQQHAALVSALSTSSTEKATKKRKPPKAASGVVQKHDSGSAHAEEAAVAAAGALSVWEDNSADPMEIIADEDDYD